MRFILPAAFLAISALTGPAKAQEATSASADQGGPITPADIMRLKDMRETAISPDGRTILFTVQAQISTFGSPEKTIWSVPSDGSAPARALIAGAGVDDTPKWSPDGKSFAFISNRKNPLAGAEAPSRQLWLVPAAGGQSTPLTAQPTDISDFAWSPDGTRIAFLSADPETPQEKADRLAKRDAVVVDKVGHVTRVRLLDLASHSVLSVSPGDVTVSALDWSPDGTKLAVRVTDSTAINDYFYHSRVVLLDPATGALGPALIEHAIESPRWSPDGRALLALVIRTPGFIGLGVRVHDLASGRNTAPADDHPGLITDLHWAPDGRSITALSFEKTRSVIVRIARKGGAVTPIARLDGNASGLTVSRDGRRIALALSSPDRPADVWTLDHGAPHPLTRINPQVASWKLGQVREISWTNTRDGHPVYGVLVTPPGYVPGTPIKTVVQIHGGPEEAWWAGWLGSWQEWAQMLAAHGYAVLLPNPRGSDGQGTAFARAVGNDWGGMDFQDVMDGVDALVAQKIADPDRLGIGGWSYGGFMSAWAVTHTHRFKAAVVGAAPVDMGAMARITDTPDFPMGYFGEPSTAWSALDRASSIRALDAQVTTPVLVLHGEQDTRVPVTLGLEFYRGLKLLGKPAEMVRYPREPHWFHEPEHQADVQARVLAWFDSHL
jgi:dipeptidyl aminopeptidase/acylaminoacyl peptidase